MNFAHNSTKLWFIFSSETPATEPWVSMIAFRAIDFDEVPIIKQDWKHERIAVTNVVEGLFDQDVASSFIAPQQSVISFVPTPG